MAYRAWWMQTIISFVLEEALTYLIYFIPFHLMLGYSWVNCFYHEVYNSVYTLLGLVRFYGDSYRIIVDYNFSLP
jgi:hypothetical protein